MTNIISQVFVGVDVSKDFLDIHLHPLNKAVRLANSHSGLNKLISLLESYAIAQIACEVSGGYEHFMIQQLTKVGYKVWNVPANRIRAFIISEGIKAKTDKIDARMIAVFASYKKPAYLQNHHHDKQLSALFKCRSDLTKSMMQENNRLLHPQQNFCQKFISAHISFMKEQIKLIEKEIQQLIKTNESFNNKAIIMESMPGIGKVTTFALIAELPELGNIGNKQIAALVGVAPFIKQSGKQKGSAHIYGGRKLVRDMLYMASTVAIRFNPIYKAFYEKLRASGKKPKVCLIAVMRKLIVTLNTMIRNNQMWQNVNA